jgi:hypothetical protein
MIKRQLDVCTLGCPLSGRLSQGDATRIVGFCRARFFRLASGGRVCPLREIRLRISSIVQSLNGSRGDTHREKQPAAPGTPEPERRKQKSRARKTNKMSFDYFRQYRSRSDCKLVFCVSGFVVTGSSPVSWERPRLVYRGAVISKLPLDFLGMPLSKLQLLGQSLRWMTFRPAYRRAPDFLDPVSNPCVTYTER